VISPWKSHRFPAKEENESMKKANPSGLAFFHDRFICSRDSGMVFFIYSLKHE
jgi:hypothetical protein